MVVVRVSSVNFLSQSRKISSNPKMAKTRVPRALRPFAEANGIVDPLGGYIALELDSALAVASSCGLNEWLIHWVYCKNKIVLKVVRSWSRHVPCIIRRVDDPLAG